MSTQGRGLRRAQGGFSLVIRAASAQIMAMRAVRPETMGTLHHGVIGFESPCVRVLDGARQNSASIRTCQLRAARGRFGGRALPSFMVSCAARKMVIGLGQWNDAAWGGGAGCRELHTIFAALLALTAAAAPAQETPTIGGCRLRPGALCADRNLRGANLSGMDLGNSQFTRSVLAGADLSGANLDESNLDRVDARNANLQSTSLRRA